MVYYKIFILLSILLLFSVNSVSAIVINEIMQNPKAVSDANGEWFELYNNGTLDVDINGWIIKDNGSDFHIINNGGPLYIPVNGYLVLGRNNNISENGNVTVNYQYSSFTLGNSDDEIILMNDTIEVDRVNYDGGPNFPDPNGKSMELINPSLDNNIGSNWAEAITTYGDGDYGTSGAQNSIYNQTNETGLSCDFGICIDITSYPKNISSLSFSINFTVWNNNTNPVTLDIGAWVVSITPSYWPDEYENQLFLVNETKYFNYTINLSELPALEGKELKVNARYSTDHSKKITQIVSVNLTKIIAKPEIDSITVTPPSPLADSEINITINFTNQDDDTNYTGNLTVKIKTKITGSWKDYQEILSQTDFLLEANKTTVFSLNWSIPSTALSGLYRVYVKFDYIFESEKTYIYSSSTKGLFNISGIGNIFLTSWNITSSTNLSLENVTTLNTTINITNNETESYNITLNLVIEDLKTISEGKHDEVFHCETFSIGNETSNMINCTWTVPTDVITNGTEKFKVHPKINFTYGNSTIGRIGETKEINITGLADLGEPELEVTATHDTVRFGDFTSVLVKYETNNYNFSLKFVAYLYSPRWASVDLDGNTLRIRPYDSNVAVEIQNTVRNQTLYISLPIFLKRNCDDDYPEGNYTGKVRVYKTGETDYIIEQSFNIQVSGKNSAFCPESTTTGGSRTVYENVTIVKMLLYELVYSPPEVHVGEEFVTKVKITNDFEEYKNFTIYSYVYEGGKLVSLGWDGEEWKGGWTANKKVTGLPPNSFVVIELKNIINNETEPGVYKLRIRVKVDDKKYDITKEITILPYEPELIPYLNVSKNENWINVSTNCEDCKLLIFMPNNLTETDESYFSFKANLTGTYYFVLTRNSTVLQKEVINITIQPESKVTEIGNLTTINIPTGYFEKVEIDKTSISYRILSSFVWLILKIILF